MSDQAKGILLAISDYPEGGASSTRLKLLSKALQKAGVDVSLALIHAASDQTTSGNSRAHGVSDGIEYVFLSGSPVRPTGILSSITDTVRGIYQAMRLIVYGKANQCDFLVVYTPYFYKFVFPIICAIVFRIPIFVEVCEIYSKVTTLGKVKLRRRIANSGESLMEAITPRFATGVIPISRPILEYYSKKGMSKKDMFLLPILVDASLYELDTNEQVSSLSGKKYFLNSGSFTEKDGIPYLIPAFERVVDEHNDVYLVFTGNASQQTRELAEKFLGDKTNIERIIFTGFLSRSQLIWAYKHAIGLLSCRSNSEYANFGFPTKVGEYLASSSPVIVTNVGDVELYLEHGVSAYIAEPENISSIAACMLKIAGNPDEARLVGENGKQVALKYFHYEEYADGLSEFIYSRI